MEIVGDGKVEENGKMSLFPNYAEPILDLGGKREGESKGKRQRREAQRERERGAETSFAANEEIPSDGATVPLDPAPITRLVYSSAANRGPRLNGKQTRPPPGQLRL